MRRALQHMHAVCRAFSGRGLRHDGGHRLNDRDAALTMLGDLLANLARRRAFKHRNAPFLSMTI